MNGNMTTDNELDDPSRTDLRARRYRALKQAGKSLGASLEDAQGLAKTIEREIRRHGDSVVRRERLQRARERLGDAQRAVEEHAAKVTRYLVEVPALAGASDPPMTSRRRSHAEH